MACNLNARNLPGAGFSEIGALARTAPAFVLHYGDFDQLDGVVNVLVRLLLDDQRDASAARRFLSAFPDPAAAAQNERAAAPIGEILAPTPRHPARKSLAVLDIVDLSVDAGDSGSLGSSWRGRRPTPARCPRNASRKTIRPKYRPTIKCVAECRS
jgi:hypothetical protein